MHFDIKSIGLAIIRLYNVSAGKIEHSATLSKERNRRIKCTTSHCNRRKAVKRCTRINRHRNLYVLNVVLVQGEYRLINICSCSTATEVCNLEGFIDVRTGINGYGTVTGNKSVNVHTAVNGNITIFFHYDITVSTYGITGNLRTLSSSDNRRNAKRTIYNDISSACHSKSSIGR